MISLFLVVASSKRACVGSRNLLATRVKWSLEQRPLNCIQSPIHAYLKLGRTRFLVALYRSHFELDSADRRSIGDRVDLGTNTI